MEFYFIPPGDRARTRHHDHDGSGLLTISRALLERHGARILHPSSAPVADGWPAPRSTVYRARTLLVPPSLLKQDEDGEDGPFELNRALELAGMTLVPVTFNQQAISGSEPADDGAEPDERHR